ncbi:hypothetical protein SE17_18950 [Kouleothrix aurantiaca]|uniref:HTH cro/C1-type domain-containing protein n=1 Tax=Kouleothrix aurantiaca TaxID=186479 RepID=A0A0P9D1J6_9CHLR|nr:hypothetical protein SE17_18950 [Kouleothrix aurantiaca]
MKMYIFKSDAAEQIGKAGLTQAEIARRCGLDKSNLHKKITLRPRIRLSTAARFATAFAELTHVTQAQAMAQLFDEAEEAQD